MSDHSPAEAQPAATAPPAGDGIGATEPAAPAGPDAQALALMRRLLADRPVAALATLHRGEPAISMVPFALQAVAPGEAVRLLLHVSALAPHTADLQAHPRVALLVTAEAPTVGPDAPAEASALALPRVSISAEACTIEREADGHAAARDAYLRRFPQAEPMFDFADFRLVALMPVSARLVAGFGRAQALTGERLRRWLLGGDAAQT